MGVIRYGRTAQIGVYPGNQSGRFISYRSGGEKFPLDPDTQVAWQFAKDKTLTDAVRGLTLDFTRTSLATYYDANGNLQTALASEPRFDHDPVTKESLGLLIEESRTNEFFDSSNPVTRSLTTTAQDYSISVWGTGSMTLSGSATGTVTEGNPLTVTATAGTLTCTVNGSLDRAQVEAGSFPTSYIETPTVLDVTATRARDECSTPDLSWLDNSVGTWYQQFRANYDPSTAGSATARPFSSSFGTSNYFRFAINTLNPGTGSPVFGIRNSAVNAIGLGADDVAPNVLAKWAGAYDLNATEYAFSADGKPAAQGATTTTPPTPNILRIGAGHAYAGPINGHIREFGYANVRKDNTFLENLTSP